MKGKFYVLGTIIIIVFSVFAFSFAVGSLIRYETMSNHEGFSLIGFGKQDIDWEEGEYLDDLSEINYINIGAEKVEIKFDEKEAGVYLSDGLQKRVSDGELEIVRKNDKINYFREQEEKIILGSSKKFDRIKVDTVGGIISGEVETSEFNLNGVGVQFKMELSADKLEINGVGIESRLNSDYIRNFEINGLGINSNITTGQTEMIEINGLGFNSNIKYIDTWEGSRDVVVSGMAGNVDLAYPAGNKGIINLSSDGLISSGIDKY